MDYNEQHKKHEKIITRHWGILLNYRILRPALPTHHLFIYRHAPTLRDLVAPGVVDPPINKETKLFSFLSGFYACGRCAACKKCCNNIRKRKDFSSTVTNKNYKIRSHYM